MKFKFTKQLINYCLIGRLHQRNTAPVLTQGMLWHHLVLQTMQTGRVKVRAARSLYIDRGNPEQRTWNWRRSLTTSNTCFRNSLSRLWVGENNCCIKMKVMKQQRVNVYCRLGNKSGNSQENLCDHGNDNNDNNDRYVDCMTIHCQWILLCHLCFIRSGGGRVVKLLACGARGPGFDSGRRHLNFQRLVISCFQVKIWLKDC